MKKVEFFASVKDGKLSGFNLKKVNKEIALLEGKRVEVRIQHKSHRSIAQNRWYWACVAIISSELGYSKEEVHAIIKFKFLKREKVNEKTGEVLEFIKSTALLTKEDFSEFMEGLINWSGETFGISLPIPEEQLRIY